VPLLPGAEPFRHEAGPVGVLLCHGFTSTPQSLRPWAEHLAAHDLTVRLPRLPGHGTTWQELDLTRWPDWYASVDREFAELRERCERVVVMGLSVGGCLALRLAQHHGGDVAGLVLVNPSLHSENPRLRALPLLRHVVRTFPAVAGDIKKLGAVEVAYDRTPAHALHSLTELWALTRRDLSQVHQPLLVFHSPEDHVVEPSNTALVLEQVSSTDLAEVVLPDSYHVATLDHDAPRIFAGSLAFVRRLAPATAGG
jgi:carboxylesterase